jgi:hypothetical protein
MVLKGFKLLQTVNEKCFAPSANNATKQEEGGEEFAFSLDKIPIFAKRRDRWKKIPPLQRLTEWAFQVCDVDQKGRINKSELYAGVLLVHLHMAKYAGLSVCYPPSREQIYALFDIIDQPPTGRINQDDFTDIVVACCAHLTSRVVIYYSTILLVVPMLVQQVIGFYYRCTQKLLPAWLGQYLALELILKQFVTLVLFVGVVPWIYNQLDQRSRHFVRPRIPFWQRLFGSKS